MNSIHSIFYWFLVTLALHLRPDIAYAKESMGVREDCRRVVAGTYLSKYDQQQRALTYAKELRQKIAKHKEALKIKEKNEIQIAAQAKKNEFDAKIAQEYEGAKQTTAAIKQHIAESEILLKDSENEEKVLGEETQKMRTEIVKVFTIVSLTPKREKAYPYKIDYIMPCSQFRYSCPLTRQHASDLLTIAKFLEEPDSCQKYAALSGIE